MQSFAARQASDEDPADLLQAKFIRGLGDPTRLRLLRLLLGGPRSVGEMVSHLSVGQSRISNHLACLKWCGYVSSQRRGRTVIYTVADPRIRALLELTRDIASGNAEHIAACMRIPSP